MSFEPRRLISFLPWRSLFLLPMPLGVPSLVHPVERQALFVAMMVFFWFERILLGRSPAGEVIERLDSWQTQPSRRCHVVLSLILQVVAKTYVPYRNPLKSRAQECGVWGFATTCNDIVDGSRYYETRLKGIDQGTSVPMEISDLSAADLKKFPEKERYAIETAKQLGREYRHYGGSRINFLKFNSRFYVTIEERSNAEDLALLLEYCYRKEADRETSRRANEWLDEGLAIPEKHSIVVELQQDNTWNIRCLYVRKDLPAKVEVK